MASQVRAAIFAFVPEGRTSRNKLAVRIGRCKLTKPVRDRFHGMNTPKVVLLDVVVDDPIESLDQLKDILRGQQSIATALHFHRWSDFTECRYGDLWFETAYSLEALVLFFEQIQRKFLGRPVDARAVRARIESERSTIEDVEANPGDGALTEHARGPADRGRQSPLETALRVIATREVARQRAERAREQEESRVHVSVPQVLRRLEISVGAAARAEPGIGGNAS